MKKERNYQRPKMGYLEVKQGSSILQASVTPGAVEVHALHEEEGFEVRFD